MRLRFVLSVAILFWTAAAFAQQRPLVTEDPEPIGAGRMLIESGVDGEHDERYPTAGLRRTLWRVATIGGSFGLSSIAEFQIEGGGRDRLWIISRGVNATHA